MSEMKIDLAPRVREEPEGSVDAYFSADVETDGPIPGPFSMLSFAIVYAGSFDGQRSQRPKSYDRAIYKELRPISSQFQEDSLKVKGLYRYFIRFFAEGSPFGYSRCFDIKTALSVKGRIPICRAGRARLDPSLGSNRAHSHHAIGDAIEQAEIFA